MLFLKGEFPQAYGNTRVRAGTKFPDSIARTAWPLEQHHNAEGYVWEPFGEDHVHYVPFASLTPVEADNIVAAVHDIDIAALRRRVAANVDA